MRSADGRRLHGDRSGRGPFQPFVQAIRQPDAECKSVPDAQSRPEPVAFAVPGAEPGGRTGVGGHTRELLGGSGDPGSFACDAGLARHCPRRRHRPSEPQADLHDHRFLDLFTGNTTVAATWSGGAFMDGLHAWSPDRGFLAYVTSDASAVNLHLLSGGGDRVVATLGAVPGRGSNPNEDDAYLAFSPDGAYFPFLQTLT